MSDDLKNSVHPYHGTHGCFYTNTVVGAHMRLVSADGARYDGDSLHHARYASWADFKTGKRMPFSKKEEELRRSVNLPPQLEGGDGGSMYNSDPDLNLLYRWDWTKQDRKQVLELFFVAQRKAYTTSVEVFVKDADEPEVRAWLWPRWVLLMRMWSPISGWPAGSADADEQSLEHVSVALATASGAMAARSIEARDGNGATP